MKAQYRSNCGICGTRIEAGDEITKVNSQWVHATHRASQVQRAFDRLDATIGRNAANDMLDRLETEQARRERAHDDAEYAAGIEDARRYREDSALMGEAWAVQNEYERDLRGLNGDWY